MIINDVFMGRTVQRLLQVHKRVVASNFDCVTKHTFWKEENPIEKIPCFSRRGVELQISLV